jgi:hypothetical protein
MCFILVLVCFSLTSFRQLCHSGQLKEITLSHDAAKEPVITMEDPGFSPIDNLLKI